MTTSVVTNPSHPLVFLDVQVGDEYREYDL